jgi:hypothetical protein
VGAEVGVAVVQAVIMTASTSAVPSNIEIFLRDIQKFLLLVGYELREEDIPWS